MMQRLIDTEYRKVNEAQHTHTISAQRGNLQSAPARPGAKEIGGSGFSSDYDATQHAHAQGIMKCSGNAERSGPWTR